LTQASPIDAINANTLSNSYQLDINKFALFCRVRESFLSTRSFTFIRDVLITTMSYYTTAQPYSVVPATATAQPYTAQPAYDPTTYTAAAQPFTTTTATTYIAAPQQTFTYNRDELRTIFVTGFPPDVRERELTNLCRFMQGFEVSTCAHHNVFQSLHHF
jgi:hypothetical protein